MGIKVNVSGKEASSAPLDPIPSGKYHVIISDVELRESNSAKNKGKPMYNIEYTVQESEELRTPEQYIGRKVYENACLWDGALYSIIQVMKALGYQVDEGELEIPEADELLGKELIVRVAVVPERTVEVNGEKKTYDKSNDVKGRYPLNATQNDGNALTSSGVSSYLA